MLWLGIFIAAWVVPYIYTYRLYRVKKKTPPSIHFETGLSLYFIKFIMKLNFYHFPFVIICWGVWCLFLCPVSGRILSLSPCASLTPTFPPVERVCEFNFTTTEEKIHLIFFYLLQEIWFEAFREMGYFWSEGIALSWRNPLGSRWLIEIIFDLIIEECQKDPLICGVLLNQFESQGNWFKWSLLNSKAI